MAAILSTRTTEENDCLNHIYPIWLIKDNRRGFEARALTHNQIDKSSDRHRSHSNKRHHRPRHVKPAEAGLFEH